MRYSFAETLAAVGVTRSRVAWGAFGSAGGLKGGGGPFFGFFRGT